MSMRRLAVLLLTLPLIGCGLAPRKLDPGKATLDDAEAARIGAEVAEQLALDFPAGQTVWAVRGEPEEPFGRALDKALRQRGFAVAGPPEPSLRNGLGRAVSKFLGVERGGMEGADTSQRLAYVVDRVDAQVYRVGIEAGADFRLDGAYDATRHSTTWTRKRNQ